MDYKFLNDRYMKGKEHVLQFAHDHHRLQHHDNLSLGHSTVVEMQAAMGQNGFLNLKLHFLC